MLIFESIYNNFSTGRNGFFERKYLNFEIYSFDKRYEKAMRTILLASC